MCLNDGTSSFYRVESIVDATAVTTKAGKQTNVGQDDVGLNSGNACLTLHRVQELVIN